MDNLITIKINENNKRDWFPRMVEYGFVSGLDFNPLKIERVQKEWRLKGCFNFNCF